MQLNLSKSVIRSYRDADAASLAMNIGSYSVAQNMSLIPYPYSIDRAVEWIGKASSSTPETHFAITIDDEVVGGIGLELADPARTTVSQHLGELGYWLGEKFWNRGIMTEAVIGFTDWCFASLNVIRVQAAVYERNLASARVLTKAGFQFEGTQRARYCKDGELMDGLMFAKIKRIKN